MKKKTNKIIISLIIVFVAFILGTVFGQEVKAADYSIPIHYHNGKENWKLSRGYIIAGNNKREKVNPNSPNIGITQVGKNRETNLAYKNIVSQNNIFCIQKGKSLSYSDKYKISSEKRIQSSQNPLLAYILCNGGNFNGMKGYTWYSDNEQQKAIWNYIKVNNGNINGYQSAIGASYSTNLYNNAQTYNNRYKAYSPKLTLKVNNSKIQASYTGLMGNMENNESVLVLDDGEGHKETKKVHNQGGTITFNTTYDASKTYTCKLTTYRSDYTAIYYILWCNGNQDILAVLHADKTTKSSEVTARIEKTSIDVNISMQKYISAVNGTTVSTSRENWQTYRGDQTYIMRDPARNISKKSSYKKTNPQEINLGDTVTYTIKVYNNNEMDLSGISIVDRIPYANGRYLVDINSISIRDITNNRNISTRLIQETGRNYNGLLQINIMDLKANSYVEININMTYNQDYANLENIEIENTSWIVDKDILNNITSYRTADRDYVRLKAPMISLQKYISKVDDSVINNRINKYSKLNDDNNCIKNPSRNDVSNKSYKYNDPVLISGSERITYTITVYNNGQVRADNIMIADMGPGSAERESVTASGGINIESNGEDGTLLIRRLEGNSSTTVTIVYKFKNTYEAGEIIENTAKIVSVNGMNNIDTTYRSMDRDYVKIKPNSVSLEKTIDQIQRKNKFGEYRNVSADIYIPSEKEKNLSTEDYKRVKEQADFNEDGKIDNKDAKSILMYATGLIGGSDSLREDTSDILNEKMKIYNNITKIINEHQAGDLNLDGKINSADALMILQYDINSEKRYVEIGDRITYNIKITNTGEGDIYVSEIYENFSNLKYISASGVNNIAINNCEDFTTNAYIDGDVKYNKKVSFRKTKIRSGDSINIKLTFAVDVPIEKTDESDTVINRAYIKDIYNNMNNKLEDADGIENNYDKVILHTKIYSVKLQKYITNVNGKELVNDKSKSGYNCNNVNRTEKTNEEKKLDRVHVEKGDNITFTIRVTNNGDDAIKYGKLKPLITDIHSQSLIFEKCEGGSYNVSNNKLSVNEIIGVGETVEIKLIFRVDSPTDKQYELDNQASVGNNVTNVNGSEVKDKDGPENNSDGDYIRTKIYKISLEKYVTGVYTARKTGNSLSNQAGEFFNTRKTQRAGHPEYNKDNLKQNNKVYVEAGDIVTFNIVLTNTGTDNVNYGTVYIKEIKDDYTNEVNKFGFKNAKCSIESDTDAIVSNQTINFKEQMAVQIGTPKILTITAEVSINKIYTNKSNILQNEAQIENIYNRNNIEVKDSDGENNNKDADYLLTKTYAVKLEKVVNTVYINGDLKRQLKPKDTTKKNFKEVRSGRPEHCDDNNPATNSDSKEKDPVTVVTNDIVEYSIIITNEAIKSVDPEKEKEVCNSAIKVEEIIDTLPDGVELIGYFNENGDKVNTKYFKDILIKPEESKELKVRVKVTEDKMSLRILKNIAEIKSNSLINRNDKSIQDTTENNNKDADYIQLNYKHDTDSETSDDNAFFAGTVWNDMALDKKSEYYNTIMDNSERKLSGIKVDLYRNSYKKENNEMDYTPITKTIVATTITDENGNYSFGDQDIHLENQRENYIKGPKISNEDNRWAGYYGYYIVFTYDGITYTSTNNGIYFEDIYNSTKDSTKDSNASEYNVNESEISGYTTRKDFNSKFATINNSTKIQGKKIQYDTVNESGYIPESTYKYDPEIMSMKSLTKEIDLSTFMGMGTDKCLERSKYIGLGLRGRDIFDLELTSDVSKVEVKVNGVTGTYDYTNKIGVRRVDVDASYYQDMANKYISEMKADYVGELNGKDGQKVRQTDLEINKTNSNYDNAQLLQSIFVTYKIKVSNASKTEGKATKVINYFDKKYKTDKITVTNGTVDKIDYSNSKYNSILINANSNEIYITYELNNAKDLLKNLGAKKLTTYNMAEIYEYTTTQYGDDDEKTYTKGILDKDSAPGSARIENARLTDEQISEATTVGYYFGGTDLDKLKYEDDTYATPTLYFTTPGSIRVLSGTVFEDYTDVYTTDRIRTGNGKQDAIEPGIKGVKVQLIEKTSSGEEIIRYETFTNSNGKFTFTNYLPGNYIMRYFYGDNQETFYIGDTNTKSYNGEDFQATNNYQEVDGAGVHILPTNENYWYTYNYDEGVSTATDIADMRKQVSTAACELSDDEMELLNNVRDGKVKVPEAGKREDGTISSLRDKLDMQAKTKQFTLTVEKSIKGKQNDEFDVYEVNKMNFGIAEVPVTTIDLQKHVNSFEIKDSTVENTIASAEITDEYIVEINKHNITDKNKYNKVKAALEKAGVDHSLAEYNTSEYGDSAKNENILVSSSVKKDKVDNLRGYLITYSIPNIITITPTWKTVGNVLPGVKATNTVLDVSIEDAKLQGAKLKITYDIAVSMYAEKDFSGTEPLQPSIDKVIDLIDNGVSYSDSLNSEGQWKVANASELMRGDSDPSETSGLESYPSTKFTTTIIESDSSNELLAIRAGYTESTSVTVERVLTSQDTSIQDIITSSIDAFEYQNTVKILQLDYTNSKVKIAGEEIKNKDRIRTPERYIIVPGKHHDSTSSETIAIHPPTGDTSTHTMYYIIGAAGLAVLAIGAFGIKKFVLKGKSTKK